MKKFGDGFFTVFNPKGETHKLQVTTSNNSTNIINYVMFDAIIGRFQCIQVEQTLNPETLKLDHKIKFNGNPILSREYDQDKVFTGELFVFISDQWNVDAGRYKVRRFIYENLD